MKITDEYVFFYKDWLSNYQRTKFDVEWNGVKYTFTSTEQGFMYIKAITFGDNVTAQKILNTDDPNRCRKLGRQVKGYNDAEWAKIRYDVFYTLNWAKYTQDKKLQEKLLDPQFDGKKFVEASPIDKIWGIGYAEDNPNIEFTDMYWGKNYLGRILTNIRKRLKSAKGSDDWNIYS
jgi:ribA/ribD-fused uncharacterized protein